MHFDIELAARFIPRQHVEHGELIVVGLGREDRIENFHAVDSRSGKELWTAKLDAPGEATPITYLGRDGKQYVVIASGSAGHLRSIGNDAEDADVVTAFALP